MKNYRLILATFLILNLCQGQVKEEVKTNNDFDALDISKETEQITKYGVPTIEAVDVIGKKAETLFTAQSWKEAIPALEDYAKNANWIANLIAQCVEPYYSASYKDKEKISYSSIKEFIPYENKANQYKKERNRAYVKIGLCYKNLGDIKKATIYLTKSLDILSVDDTEYWNLAKNALSEIIKFTPNN